MRSSEIITLIIILYPCKNNDGVLDKLQIYESKKRDNFFNLKSFLKSNDSWRVASPVEPRMGDGAAKMFDFM